MEYGLSAAYPGAYLECPCRAVQGARAAFHTFPAIPADRFALSQLKNLMRTDGEAVAASNAPVCIVVQGRVFYMSKSLHHCTS